MTTPSKKLTLHFNPRSTYSQKALIALYEKDAAFDSVIIDFRDPASLAALKSLYPLAKIPVLVVGEDHLIPESTIIIEYLDQHFAGQRLIAVDPELARRTRFLDRFADNYINNTFQTIYFDSLKPESERDPKRVASAVKTQQTVLRFFEREVGRGPWLLGETFSMADCALAPPLGYMRGSDMLNEFPNLAAYLNRVVERPSFARALAQLKAYKG